MHKKAIKKSIAKGLEAVQDGIMDAYLKAKDHLDDIRSRNRADNEANRHSLYISTWRARDASFTGNMEADLRDETDSDTSSVLDAPVVRSRVFAESKALSRASLANLGLVSVAKEDDSHDVEV
mmetsp:Transcript_17681/g.23154  ORF Transcript_17681/g.23154 Transcript_17681/m.23154 type:complete len:123 (+) Transcript_17681:2-370(+)